MLELNKIYNIDCLEGLKLLPDNSVDLIVTDPPYGINADKGVGGFGSSPKSAKKYSDNWDDKTPDKVIFDEILRVGKVVLIFGGNYFTDKLPVNGHWIVWDKINNIKFDNPFSDCELIWTNVNKNSVKKFIFVQQGFVMDNDFNNQRFHPTQKPLKIIRDLIKNYSKEEDLVLDPFMGSGTTAVACKQLNRNFVGFELDERYVAIANNRLKQDTLNDFSKYENLEV